jgi:M6 family metalloprotease-like protein
LGLGRNNSNCRVACYSPYSLKLLISRMRIKSVLAALLIASFLFPISALAAAPKAGATCKKIGEGATVSGIKFTCIKSNKKLIWNKRVVTPSVTPSAAPSATPSAAPSATPSAAPSATPSAAPSATPGVDVRKACKLPIADGRGDVAIGGFPRISERLKTTGNVVTAVVMVDFSDAPATMTPQEAFSNVSGATATFDEVSYGKLNYTFVPNYKWYRMSKPATSYAPLNQSFDSHRAYIMEALTLADADTDFSKVDNFLILANPNAKGLGNSGPGFSAIRGNGVTFDGKYLSNGATSAADLLGWGSIWLNHEITHTMGMVDLYSFKEDAASIVKGTFRFTGEFSYMGLSAFTSASPGLLAWERWVLGWLNDEQIICMSNNSLTQTISAVENVGGIKAVVIPLDGTKALVVESRRAIGLDKKMSKVGALVYLVNSSIQSGLGPVQIYPQSASDQKYWLAPRAVGESITVEGVTITITQADQNSDTVKIER